MRRRDECEAAAATTTTTGHSSVRIAPKLVVGEDCLLRFAGGKHFRVVLLLRFRWFY